VLTPARPRPPPPQAANRGRSFEPEAFAAFRSAPLAASAAALAAAGAAGPAALAALLQRHPAALGRGLLDLLSALPLALDPKGYAPLLPDAASGAPSRLPVPGPASAPPARVDGAQGPPTGSGGRRSDWVEAPEAWQELAAAAAGGHGSGGEEDDGDEEGTEALARRAAALMHATEDMERFSLAAADDGGGAAAGDAAGASLWPAPRAVAAWWPRRALQLGSAPDGGGGGGGRLARALAFIDLALDRGADPGAAFPLEPAALDGPFGAAGPPVAWASLGQLQTAASILHAAAATRAAPPTGGSGLQSVPSDPHLPPPPPGAVGLGQFLALPLASQLRLVMWGRRPTTLEADVAQRCAGCG
jgi:hypothetical protein